MIENIERQKIKTDNEERVKENNTLKESLSQKLKEERTNTIVQDKTKEMFERQNSEDVGKVIIKDMQKPKTNSSKESLRRKIEVEEKIRHEREIVNKGRKNNYGNLKEKANSDSVVKVKEEIVKVVNRKDKKCNSLKEKIDERLKLIERSIIDTQNDSLTELTKKMKILNTLLETDRKRDNSFKYY